mgnify:CR=1 FL=1|jgi:hypothetical protein
MIKRFKGEIQNFSITGFKTDEVKSGPRVHLAFQAEAKGRIVEWNKISGSALVPLALVTTEGFGPGDISARDFSWVVHITRGGKPVNRAMKATPRKDAINSALCQLLAPALASEAAMEISSGLVVKPKKDNEKTLQESFNDREVAPKVMSPTSDQRKAVKNAIERAAAGAEAEKVKINGHGPVPSSMVGVASDKVLEMPEFLKR